MKCLLWVLMQPVLSVVKTCLLPRVKTLMKRRNFYKQTVVRMGGTKQWLKKLAYEQQTIITMFLM